MPAKKAVEKRVELSGTRAMMAARHLRKQAEEDRALADSLLPSHVAEGVIENIRTLAYWYDEVADALDAVDDGAIIVQAPLSGSLPEAGKPTPTIPDDTPPGTVVAVGKRTDPGHPDIKPDEESLLGPDEPDAA